MTNKRHAGGIASAVQNFNRIQAETAAQYPTDKIARAKLVMRAVDDYTERPTGENRAAIRKLLMDLLPVGVRVPVVTDAMVEAGALVLCGEEAIKDASNAAWGRNCARKVLAAALGVKTPLKGGA